MRNIYDIIAEQKSMVDVNLLSLELKYISEDYEIIQEGMGDGIKKIINSIIEFIKKMIRKVKEFVSKITGYFRNDRDYVKEADNLIKEVNQNIANHPAAMGAANAAKAAGVDMDRVDNAINNVEKELSKRKVKECNSLIDLLKNSDKKVNTSKIGPIDKKLIILDKFITLDKALTSVEPVINDWTKAKDVDPSIVSNEVKKALLGDNDGNITESLNRMFGDSSEQVTFVVKSKANEIYDYMVKGRKFIKGLNMGSKGFEDDFNAMARDFEQAGKKAASSMQNAEALANKASAIIRNASNIIVSVLNHTARSTTIAYNQYKAICDKLIHEYAVSHGKTHHKERKEVSRKMYSTAKERDIFAEKEKEYDAMNEE